MKLNILKFSKNIGFKKNKLNISKIENLDFTCTMVHTGRILTPTEVNNNRSSKYTYLTF